MNNKFIYLLPAILFLSNTAKTLAANNNHLKHKAIHASNLYADYGDYIVLDNGIVSVKITKNNAHITSYTYKGFEVLKDGYYSMDGGAGYSQPSHCTVLVKTQTPTLVDVVFKSTWQLGLRQQAFDIEAHYVIEKGTSGIYCYALLAHPASYPQTRVGEWRYVWKVPQDLFDHIMIDSIRNMELPTSADLAKAEKTTIPEAVKLTTGVKADTYECKYEYSVEYYDAGTYGQASNKNKIGGWMVLGGYDFFNDGPTQADLNAANGGILVHFGRDHYGGSGTSVDASEEWNKVYGPFLLYMNSDNAGAAAMWGDAKKKVAEEKLKWPYKWLTDITGYTAASERGNASGTFVVKDTFKPSLTGANAWVGLTTPGIDWQKESKHYQYWAKADSKGKFMITNIRPGTYNLHAYVNGAVGEFAKENIVIKQGPFNMGNVEWDISRNKGKLVWEIGIPDRTAREFKFGNQYWNSFMWETYSRALPNPLVYDVNTSNWSTDWNYVQSAYCNKNGSFSPWPWKINFTIAKLPATGVATLTFAFASADRARLQTFVNDDAKPFDVFSPLNQGGNALVRQGIHAKYSTYELSIPVSKLHAGNNTITLLSNNGNNRTDHIMYDYISFEVPE